MTSRHRTPSRRWLVVLIALGALALAGGFGLGAIPGLRSRDDAPPPGNAGATPSQEAPGPSPGSEAGVEAAPEDPVPAPPPPQTRGRLVIHGVGDVNLDPSYIPALAANGYAYAWSGLKGLFKRDHLTVVNLECAVSDLGSPTKEDFNFRCDPAALPAMRRAGVEVANLANNHGRDFGPEALLDSRRNLLRAGIDPVGVGRGARHAHRPAIFEIKGWEIAVLGFGGVIPGEDWLAGPGNPGMANGDDIASMVAAVKAADEEADLVFVTIHWGMELKTEPLEEDVELARALIDAGADGIFGHHSHRLNPIDRYKGRPIAWGLGNFVWPFLGPESATTAVAEFVVTPAGKVRGRLIPAYIQSSGHPVLLD